METEDGSPKCSSVGTVNIVASDFNPPRKTVEDHKSSSGTMHIEYKLNQ